MPAKAELSGDLDGPNGVKTCLTARCGNKHEVFWFHLAENP